MKTGSMARSKRTASSLPRSPALSASVTRSVASPQLRSAAAAQRRASPTTSSRVKSAAASPRTIQGPRRRETSTPAPSSRTYRRRASSTGRSGSEEAGSGEISRMRGRPHPEPPPDARVPFPEGGEQPQRAEARFGRRFLPVADLRAGRSQRRVAGAQFGEPPGGRHRHGDAFRPQPSPLAGETHPPEGKLFVGEEVGQVARQEGVGRRVAVCFPPSQLEPARPGGRAGGQRHAQPEVPHRRRGTAQLSDRRGRTGLPRAGGEILRAERPGEGGVAERAPRPWRRGWPIPGPGVGFAVSAREDEAFALRVARHVGRTRGEGGQEQGRRGERRFRSLSHLSRRPRG